jgi:hypothetical protein
MSHHVLHWTINKADSIILDHIANEMISYINVLRPGVDLAYVGIGEGDGRRVIAMERDGVFKWAEQLSDELAEPNGLLCGIGHRNIFGLGRGEGSKFLFLGTPRYSATINNESIS